MSGKKTIVIGTFLPPTRGHEYLLDFAHALGRPVTVLINTRDCEPIPGGLRHAVLSARYPNVHRYHGDVPQNPSEAASPEEFWEFWANLLIGVIDAKPGDFLVGSELYCVKLAEILGMEFIPCDIARAVVPVSGTEARWGDYDALMEGMKPFFSTRVTIFGAESTGKTTLSRSLARRLGGTFVPEWAREYLETCGTEITEHSMRRIVEGQTAVQRSVRGKFIVQDTDLLSTLGYYRIFGLRPPHELLECLFATRSHLYIVMSSDIPFEPDPIRYGGDRRESSDQFWIGLLQEYDCSFITMPADTPERQLDLATDAVDRAHAKRMKPIREFQRT